jgi:chromosome partitioning protein
VVRGLVRVNNQLAQEIQSCAEDASSQSVSAFGDAAQRLDGCCPLADEMRPGEKQGQHAKEFFEPLLIIHAGVFEPEASAFERSKEGFNVPAQGVILQGVLGALGADDNQIAAKKRNIIFIDADPQQSASAWIKELSVSIQLETLDNPEEIIRRVAKLAAEADDIVIDGPAGLSETTRAVMVRADRVFLPCGPSILDLRAASKAVQLLQEAQKARKGLPKGALIPNKLQKRGRLSREMLGAVQKLKVPVLAGLSQRQAFADAAGQAKVVSDMGAPAFLAAHEMKQLLKEMTRV